MGNQGDIVMCVMECVQGHHDVSWMNHRNILTDASRERFIGRSQCVSWKDHKDIPT